MNSILKIGDRVRILDKKECCAGWNEAGMSPFIGTETTISEVHGEYNGCLIYRLTSNVFTWCKHSIEKISSTTELRREKSEKVLTKIVEEPEKSIVLYNINKRPFRFGIELECFSPNYEDDDRIQYDIAEKQLPFKVGDDSSIDGDGATMEIRSSGATTYSALTKAVPQLCTILKEYDVKVNSSCGYHLHVSNPKFFDPIYIKRIMLVWASIEDVLIATQPRSRLNNGYCKRYLAQFVADEKNSRILPKGKDQLRYELSSNDRYRTLNFSALQKHGTIEIRLHAGTVTDEKILAWVELMTALFGYSLHHYNRAKVMELFLMPISEDKIKQAWNLLGISKELRSYYNSRINKFLFEGLQKQQESANRIVRNLKTLKKAEKALSVAQSNHKTLESTFRQDFDTLRA